MFVFSFILLLALRQQRMATQLFSTNGYDQRDNNISETFPYTHTFQCHKWVKGLQNANESLTKKIRWIEVMKLYPMQKTRLDF